MARRGDGVYRRGKTWYLDFTHRRERHITRLGSHISRTAARELASITRARILKGEAGIDGPAPITVKDYAARWLREITGQVTAKTRESYQQMLDYYILPTLGEVNLGTLDRGAVKALLLRHRHAGRSKNTVRLIKATLSVLCGDAMEDGFVTVNPAQGLGRRGRSGPGSVSQAERQLNVRPFSMAQLEAFLQVAQGRAQGRVFYLTLADAGLRPGEALALRWEDLDPADQVLEVKRALSGTTVKPTKTHARRRVELTPRLLAALEDWQANREAEALAAGREPAPWIFADPAGHPLNAKVVARRFRLLCRRAGLPRFRLYDLRHSYATHLLAEGAPITYVAAQLGHTKPTTTLAYYAHWLPTAERVWARRLEAARGKFHDANHDTAGSVPAAREDAAISE